MFLRHFNQAELVLTQRLHLERPMLVLMLLGSAGYSVARDDWFFFLLLGLGVLVNAIALYLRSEISLPRPVVTAGVLLATGFFVLDFLHTPEFFLVLAHYLTLILLCKLFEQKRNRDYAEMIVLSIVLMLDGALVTVRLGFAVLLLAYVPLAAYVAMVLSLKIALDRQAQRRLTVEHHSPDPQTLAWNMTGRFPARALWVRAMVAGVNCFLAAAVVYVLIPRIQPGLLVPLTANRGGGERVTGVPSSFRLTDLGRIRPDPRVVMQVQIEDGQGHDLGAGGYSAYLRGNVYDNYRSGEWFLGPQNAVSFGATDRGARNRIIQHVVMDPSLLPTLFAIAPNTGKEPVAGDSLTSSVQDLAEPRPDDAPIRYVAYSVRPPYSTLQWRYLNPSVGEQLVKPSAADDIAAPVANLAAQWCQDLLAERNALGGVKGRSLDELNLRIASRLMDKLHEGYEYTLDLSAFDPNLDPVEDFLLHTKRGHCEFFASAMTLMARSLGLQARLCGGFLADGTAYSPSSKAYMVRAADAHAWVEVYTPSTYWTLFDPTPPGSRNDSAESLRKARNFWSDLAFFWRTRVIGYGEADRQNLFGKFLDQIRVTLLKAWAMLVDAVNNLAAMILHGQFNGRMLLRMLPGVSFVLSAGALVGLIVALLRRHRRRVRLLVRPQQAPGFYKRLHKVLERQGVYHHVHQTPREFLASAAASLDLSGPVMADLAGMVEQSRWGQRPLPEESVQRAQESLDRIEAQLKRRKKPKLADTSVAAR